MKCLTVVTLATGKGGAGKSTLTRGLAGYWLKKGLAPAIIDADPEARIARRYRKDGPMAAVPVQKIADHTKIADAVGTLQDKHRPILIDTAGFQNKTQVMACLAADMVLIPLRPAPDDVDDALAMLDLIDELSMLPEREGRPILARLVMTMVRPTTIIARSVRRELERAELPVLTAALRERVSFVEAAINGLSPAISEPGGAAADDLHRIALEIEQIAEEAHVQAAWSYSGQKTGWGCEGRNPKAT